MNHQPQVLGRVHWQGDKTMCVECLPLDAYGWHTIHTVHPDKAHVCAACGGEWGGPTTGLDASRFSAEDV